MRRKHNPWVGLAALVLLVTLLVAVCTGCGGTQADAEEPDRFTVERAQYGYGVDFVVITDNETGVQYLYADRGYGGGITPLLPAPAEEGLKHGKE